jgi:hypothetical protein
MRHVVAAVLIIVFGVGSTSAAAADPALEDSMVASNGARTVSASPFEQPWTFPFDVTRVPDADRPAPLRMLDGGLIGANAADWYTTIRAVGRGYREANPLMAPLVMHPAVFGAVKAAATVATIYAAERMWKRNRGGAIVMMVTATATTWMVAGRNATLISQGVSVR